MSDKFCENKNSFKNIENRVIKLTYDQSLQRRPIDAVRNSFVEYSERSTIHGVRYFGETRLHWSERMWWVISFTMSVTVCIYFVNQIYLKMTPVVITFEDEATHISEIPFPTITICNDVKMVPKVLNFTRNVEAIIKNIEGNKSENKSDNFKITEEAIQQMYALRSICMPWYFNVDHDILDSYVQANNIKIDRNVWPHMQKVSPKLMNNGEYFLDFSYLSNMTEVFSEILTDDGLCYTFNQLGTNDMYHEEILAYDFPRVNRFKGTTPVRPTLGLKEKFRTTTFPYRVGKAGRGCGLNIFLRLPKNERYYDKYYQGDSLKRNNLQIHINSADDAQMMDHSAFIIPLNHDVTLAVRPNIMSTDRGLINNYSKQQRKCVSETENDLKFYRKYSQRNCYLEILTNLTVTKCGCACSCMPRLNETRICTSAGDLECFEIVLDRYYANFTNKCLPACDSISYDTKMIALKMDSKQLLLEGIDKGDMYASISIFFDNELYFSKKRSESYGRIDFIAGCGGILGLFMGVSFLSVIEIAYFTTLRLFFNVRRTRRMDVWNQADIFKETNDHIEIIDHLKNIDDQREN